MEQPLPDDFFGDDPLSGFTTEPEPAVEDPTPAEDATPPEVAEPARNVEVAAAEPVIEPGNDAALIAMRERVDRVESALADSTAQVQTLKSEVATLVGTIADIKKQMVRRATAAAPFPVAARQAPAGRRVIPAIAGLLLGLALATAGWAAWSRDSNKAIASTPATVTEPQQAAPEPAPAVTEPATQTPIEIPAAPVTPARDFPARDTHIIPASTRIDADAAPINYVGTLSIDASPGGDVFLNRKPAGHTPLRLANLKAGSHLIWIERDGYRRFTRVVQVPADRVTRLSAELEPIAER